MSAIDHIHGGKAKGVKKTKTEESWRVEGPTLFFNGAALDGTIDWDRSRYLKTGHVLNFHCMMSGSNVMYVMPETLREGYVPPKDFGWHTISPGIQTADHDTDGEDEE